MTDEEKTLFTQAKERCGKVNQIHVAIEEMSELQKELCKFMRGKSNKVELSEELADVRIMLDQLELMFNIEEECKSFRQHKIARLSDRLKSGDDL